MEHFRTSFDDEDVVIRDLEERDIDRIVDYWHDSDPAFLTAMGADLGKLVSRDATRQRFRDALIGRAVARSRTVIVVTANDRLIAYSNVNFWSDEEGAAHVHVLEQTMRNRGLASLLFGPGILLYFRRFPLKRLWLQTSPGNDGINRLIQKFGIRGERRYLDAPDGMARPGEFMVYEVTPHVAARLKLPGLG